MAAASPVILDDGGSTRIKQVKDNVFMDRLLDLLKDQADGRFVNDAGNFSCTMKVRFHENDGDQHTPVVNVQLTPSDTVIIVSQNQQMVKLTFDPNYRLTVELSSAVSGVLP